MDSGLNYRSDIAIRPSSKVRMHAYSCFGITKDYQSPESFQNCMLLTRARCISWLVAALRRGSLGLLSPSHPEFNVIHPATQTLGEIQKVDIPTLNSNKPMV